MKQNPKGDNTTKAVYIDRPGEIAVREEAMPQITAPDDVIMRVKYTGICGSDVHIYQGENAFVVYPRVFGHEFVGEVTQVGPGVADVKIGDHVVGEPIDYCGKCYACRVGHPNVCEHLQVYGVHVNGGCQTYMKMPAKRTHKISPDVPWEYAVLTEPMTIGFRSCNRAEVLPGDYVLIQGSGTIGLCAMLAAKAKGAVVIMTDLFDEKLEYARSLGADYVLNAKTQDVEKEIMAITEGMGPNVVLDAVGNKKSLESALDMVSAAGRIVELGMSPVESGISHLKLCRRDITVMGTRLQAREFPEAVAYLEENWKHLEGFVTDIYPVERVKEAFDRIVHNPGDVRKILVEL